MVAGSDVDTSNTFCPQAPTHARLEGERASFFGPFILIPGFFALSGAILVTLGISRVNRVRALYANGEPALASVTSIERTATRVNGRPMLRVNYEFRAGVESATGDYLTPSPPEVRSEIWVLYAPGKPSNNSPYQRA
jgi:hypothetical protein